MNIKIIVIGITLLVILTVGFSLLIMEVSGYNKSASDYKPKVKAKTKMIMKCGEGKCGATMMEEVN